MWRYYLKYHKITLTEFAKTNFTFFAEPGFGGTGGSISDKHCASNYISMLYGRGGDALDQLGVKCGNDFWDAGNVGGSGGSYRELSCIGGFTSVKVTYGDFIGKVSAYCKASNSYQSIGEARNGQTNSYTGELRCIGSNQVLVRAVISGGALVDRVTFYCGGNKRYIKLLIHMILFFLNYR